ncbi:MAG: hypothetical protein EBU65_05385 [Actinobacteria bacterium]|nr:hypothetical protein [Actinomycetota bacterium]
MEISVDKAISHATSLLVKAGVNEVNSEKTARAIVTSDVWGNPSHGLMRLPFYLQKLLGLTRLLPGSLPPLAVILAASSSSPSLESLPMLAGLMVITV